MWKEAIGWVSSVILVLTVGHQVLKQWREGKSEGVSRWLFLGEVAASAGFIVYSVLVHSVVFVATNSLMLLNAVTGYGLVVYHRRKKNRGSGGHR
jgi:MtN3 and saliva related transmembrane protein